VVKVTAVGVLQDVNLKFADTWNCNKELKLFICLNTQATYSPSKDTDWFFDN
jgi:hypothetical protein